MIRISQDHNYLEGYFKGADLETKATICDIVEMTYHGAFTGLMGLDDSYTNYCNYLGISEKDISDIREENNVKREMELLSTLTVKYRENV